MSTPARPSLSDVARLAGVSHQTVSRVVNGSAAVTAETRARVLAAMEEVDYRPNVAARALASRRSQTIGVLALETSLFGPTTTLYAVERAARAAGWFVSVASAEPGSDTAAVTALEQLTRQAVEGLIVIAPTASATRALRAMHVTMPVVVAGASQQWHSVGVDQVAGARLATAHLLQQGCEEVAHVAGPQDWHDARGRQRGWRLALTGRHTRAQRVVAGDWSADSGYAAGAELLSGAVPDGVFVANDLMAMGVLHAFADGGVRVPDDVLVASFDDMPGAAHVLPALTTVRQDLIAVGADAVTTVTALIGGTPPEARRHLIRPELVVRASSGR